MNNEAWRSGDLVRGDLRGRTAPTDVEALALAARVDPRFRGAWAGWPAREQAALAAYYLPHCSRQPLLKPTRPRILKFYCPFGHQTAFPSGHRYCLNVYAGCAHGCRYCYAAAYQRPHAASKRDFARLLDRDLADLERFDVPPAPVHVSNSTDPFQPLECELRHTWLALEGILAHRRRFTTVVVLTKNPGLAAQEDYVRLLRPLGVRPPPPGGAVNGTPGVIVEVSLAFGRDQARAFWDPQAPTVTERLEGIRALRAAGLSVVLRIDPLFPRSPLGRATGRSLADFGLVEAQTQEDLERLLAFAKEVGVRHVVYSPAKIVVSRRMGLDPVLRRLRNAYEVLSAPEQLEWRGGSWRLPCSASERWITGPFVDLCGQAGLQAKFCMKNLLETE